MPEYPITDELDQNACMHCVALFLLSQEPGVQPTAQDTNATMTLLSYGSKVYGITCWHVVDALQRRNAQDPSQWMLATVVNGIVCICDRFIRPSAVFPSTNQPDLVIRQLHPNYPARIGKQPICLDGACEPPWDRIRHGMAVGFPGATKEPVDRDGCRGVAVTCVRLVAEGQVHPGECFHLHSELNAAPDVQEFGGMSGGPVFWSTENEHGLLGIMYEAERRSNHDDCAPRIWIVAESVTVDRFTGWVDRYSELHEDLPWL